MVGDQSASQECIKWSDESAAVARRVSRRSFHGVPNQQVCTLVLLSTWRSVVAWQDIEQFNSGLAEASLRKHCSPRDLDGSREIYGSLTTFSSPSARRPATSRPTPSRPNAVPVVPARTRRPATSRPKPPTSRSPREQFQKPRHTSQMSIPTAQRSRSVQHPYSNRPATARVFQAGVGQSSVPARAEQMERPQTSVPEMKRTNSWNFHRGADYKGVQDQLWRDARTTKLKEAKQEMCKAKKIAKTM